MASFRVPKSYYAGFATLATLSEDSAQELFSSLERAPVTFSFKNDLRRAVAENDAIQGAEITQLADTLMSLYMVYGGSGKEAKDFAEDIVESLEKEDKNKDTLKRRLVTLLSINNLVAASKAVDLLYENANNLVKARVVTDVRTVFSDGVEDLPIAALLVHTLCLEYMQGNRRKEFFIAMDVDDVQKMISVLERAREKTESLKRIIATTNLRYVEPNGGA